MGCSRASILDRRHVWPAGVRHAGEQQRTKTVVSPCVVAPTKDDEPQVSLLAGARNQRAVRVDKFYLQRHLAERVRGVRDVRARTNFLKGERGFRPFARVDEQSAIRAFEVERMFDLQLIVFDRDEVGRGRLSQTSQQQRPQPIVAARLIAPAEDDEAQF